MERAGPINRREFFSKGIGKVLWALGAAFVAYPALSFMSFRKVMKKTVVFSPDEQLSSVNLKEGVFLVKREKEAYALSARCTHLGCIINYDPVSQRFRCPCHGSVFDLSGQRVDGPAKRALEKVPMSKKENGDVLATLTL